MAPRVINQGFGRVRTNILHLTVGFPSSKRPWVNGVCCFAFGTINTTVLAPAIEPGARDLNQDEDRHAKENPSPPCGITQKQASKERNSQNQEHTGRTGTTGSAPVVRRVSLSTIRALHIANSTTYYTSRLWAQGFKILLEVMSLTSPVIAHRFITISHHL